MDEDEGNSGVSLSTIYKDLFHMNTSSFLYQRGDASFLWNGRNLNVEKAYGASVYLAAEFAGKIRRLGDNEVIVEYSKHFAPDEHTSFISSLFWS